MRKPKLKTKSEALAFPASSFAPPVRPGAWTCFRCEDPAGKEHQGGLSIKGQNFEGEIPLCIPCLRTIVACLEKRTRLTPIYSPPEVKRFCAVCRFRVWNSDALCIACKARSDEDESA